MEVALQSGQFIGYNRMWSFVSGLEVVEKDLAKLVRDDAPRAVKLYETFLAGCYEKTEEIDDSSGNFGMFVDGLFCGWVKARQKTKANPQETAERLLAWMEDDPYGYAYQLERHVAKVLNKSGLKAFAETIRARFELAAQAGQSYLHEVQQFLPLLAGALRGFHVFNAGLLTWDNHFCNAPRPRSTIQPLLHVDLPASHGARMLQQF
jgi:hypothetical protein